MISATLNYLNWFGYFNEVAGGLLNGWKHLNSSNVDWGQDLLILNDWITSHPECQPIDVRTRHVIDTDLYLRSNPQSSHPDFIAIDASSLVHDARHLIEHEVVARVGTSFFVFKAK